MYVCTEWLQVCLCVCVCVRYLQQYGPTREAELDAVLGGVLPGQQLQVLDGAVGQGRLHVASGLRKHTHTHSQ